MRTRITIIFILCVQVFYARSQELNKNFEIKIDPRMELLSIFLSYTDWPYFGKFEDTTYVYYQKVKSHFDKFKDNPNIAWFEKASENWNLDDPATLMLWVSSPPNMSQIHPYPLHPTCQLDTIEFQNLIQKLNEYADNTEFMDFWNENQDLYYQFEKNIKELVPYNKFVQLMMEFYGEDKAQFIFIPAPMFKWVSFGPQLNTANGEIPHFISTFTKYEDGNPYFTEERLRMLIFHEFGHSFVNPICEKYRTEIFNHVEFFEYLKKDMSAIAYPDWFPTFHEHIVRTGENMLLERAGYKVEAEENYKENLRDGFYLLPYFKEKMEYYDQNRDQYESFDQFFPELLKVFEEVEPYKTTRPVKMGIYLKNDKKGLLIRRISENSPFKDQLLQNDIILAVNYNIVSSKKDINKIYDMWYNAKEGDSLKFKLLRNNEVIYQTIPVSIEDCYKVKKKDQPLVIL